MLQHKLENSTTKKSKVKLIFILLSLSIYLISLTQKALTYQGLDGLLTYPSIAVVISGALAILGGGLAEWLVWLANPLYFLSLLFVNSPKNSKFLSMIALLLSISFSLWNEVLVSENGRQARIISLEPGYFLWVASICIFVIGQNFFFQDKTRIMEM